MWWGQRRGQGHHRVHSQAQAALTSRPISVGPVHLLFEPSWPPSSPPLSFPSLPHSIQPLPSFSSHTPITQLPRWPIPGLNI